MAFERLLRLIKKCPGYVMSRLRNAKRWYSNCHSRVVRKPILHPPGSFLRPVTFCHDSPSPFSFRPSATLHSCTPPPGDHTEPPSPYHHGGSGHRRAEESAP